MQALEQLSDRLDNSTLPTFLNEVVTKVRDIEQKKGLHIEGLTHCTSSGEPIKDDGTPPADHISSPRVLFSDGPGPLGPAPEIWRPPPLAKLIPLQCMTKGQISDAIMQIHWSFAGNPEVSKHAKTHVEYLCTHFLICDSTDRVEKLIEAHGQAENPNSGSLLKVDQDLDSLPAILRETLNHQAVVNRFANSKINFDKFRYFCSVRKYLQSREKLQNSMKDMKSGEGQELREFFKWEKEFGMKKLEKEMKTYLYEHKCTLEASHDVHRDFGQRRNLGSRQSG